MANTQKNVTGSSYLTTQFWEAHNPEEQEHLNELVRRARDTSLPDVEAIKGLADYIVAQAESDGVEFECAYFARHFLDDPEAKDMIDPETGKKYPHLHFVLHVSSKDGKDQGCSFPQWEKYIGINRNRIEKLKPGNTEQRKDNSISYLTHIKYPEKTQYGPEIVYTARGRDYMEVYSQRYSAWNAGRAVISQTKATSKEHKALVVEQIVNDQLPWRQLISTKEGVLLYGKYKAEIDTLYAVTAERKRLEKLESYVDNPFKRTNIFFTGDAGHGKSWSAGQLAQHIVDYVRAATGEEWTVFDPADGPNGLDDYAGQEIIVFDDLKPSELRWEAMKRFFDPFKPISSFGARYKNSQYCARVNIITCTKNIYEYFYANKTREVDENIEQGLRRIHLYAEAYNLAADTDTTEIDVLPTSDTMRISLKKPVRFSSADPMHLKIDYPRCSKDVLDYTVRYAHQVPADLPAWLRPETAIDLMLEEVMVNNNIPHQRTPKTIQSIANSLILNEQYDTRRNRNITEKGRTSEGGATSSPMRGTGHERQPEQPIIRHTYLSPECFVVNAAYGTYAINLPTAIGPDGSRERVSYDLYQLREYLDELILQDEADYNYLKDDEIPHLDFGGNPFIMPEEEYIDKVRDFAPILEERL